MKVSLQAARVNANLTQEDVAKALRKSKTTIVSWEKGKSEIDKANFEALCKLYNCYIDDIFLPLKSTKSELKKEGEEVESHSREKN